MQLDYRTLEKPQVRALAEDFNLNVLGVWLVDTYRSQFSEINAKGIDGLIATLSERNKSNAAGDTQGQQG